MAVPLSECTTLEQHSIVQFLWAKGMESKHIHKEMLPITGEKCLSRQAVYNWVQKFSEGRTHIEDEHCVGRPTEIATEENVQRVEDLIRADRRVTIDTIATSIGCSHGMAYLKKHDKLGFHKVSMRGMMGATHADLTT
ncbi:protein GVQW3-like [Cryptotermes secundus]|uniref:protein GVQW3-like n=1 Tax=Cryptotermes secundus TaxID=105785 RepID=UPI000CD7B4ED|nr:protein GVQW3-like [Cryptotermes secundus]